MQGEKLQFTDDVKLAIKLLVPFGIVLFGVFLFAHFSHAAAVITRAPSFTQNPIYSNPTFTITASTESDLINLAEYTTGTCGAGQYWDIMITSVDPNSVASQYYVSDMFPTSQLSANVSTWHMRPGGGGSTSTISSPSSGFGAGTLPLSSAFTSGADHYQRLMIECYASASLGSSRTGFGIERGLNDSYNGPDWFQILTMPSPKVELVYPYQNAQTPEFSTWVLSQEFFNPTSTGYFGVNYGQNSSSLNYTDTCAFENWSGPCMVKLDPYDSGYTGGVVRKNNGLISNSIATSTWYAQPYYFNANTMSFTYGSTTKFQVQNDFSKPNSTSSIQNLAGTLYATPSGNTTSTLRVLCKPASDWTDIGGGIAYGFCAAGQFLFTPNSITADYFNNSLNNFKNTFPFNIVFNLTDTLNAVASTTISSSSKDLYIPFPAAANSSKTIAILTSTTLETAVGSSTKNFLFTLADNAMWLTTIAAVVATIL